MRFARYLFLLTLLGGLLIVYFRFLPARKSEKQSNHSNVHGIQETKQPEASRQLLLGQREELETLVLVRKDLRLKMAKTKKGWFLLSPVQGKVEDSLLSETFRQFHTLALEKPFEVEPKEMNRFGLTEPRFQLEFTTTLNGETRILRLGDRTPQGNFTYAHWLGEKRGNGVG